MHVTRVWIRKSVVKNAKTLEPLPGLISRNAENALDYFVQAATIWSSSKDLKPLAS